MAKEVKQIAAYRGEHLGYPGKELLEDQALLHLSGIGKYREIFQDAPVGIFKATIEGLYLEANTTLAGMLGFDTPSELITETRDIARQIYARPEERKRLMKEILNGAEILRYETFFKRKDKSSFPVSLTLKLTTGETGKPKYVSGIVEDITEAYANRERLVKERNLLRLLIDNIPDYIYLKDLNQKFILANTAFASHFGKADANELTGKSEIDFIGTDLITSIIANDGQILKNGKPVQNIELKTTDSFTGKDIYIYTTKLPLRDNKNRVYGLLSITRNVTELKTAGAIISKGRANLKAVVESALYPIWSVDKEFIIITANSHFEHFSQTLFKKRMCAGNNFLLSLPKSIRPKWQDIFERAFRGEHWTQEDLYLQNDISLYYELAVNPIFDSNHEITGITFFYTNITDRKHSEAVIIESEERFRQLAENTNDVFILSDEKRVLYANPAFERVFGQAIEALLANPGLIEICIHPDDRWQFVRNSKKKHHHPPQNKGFQYRIIKPGESIAWIWFRSFPVYNDSGKPYRQVAVVTDITEQSELQHILAKSKLQQRAILDNIPYLAWLKDSEGKYISVNQPFAKSLNLAIDQIIGKTDQDLFGPQKAVALNKKEIEIKGQLRKQLFEEVETLNGVARWTETYITPIFNDDGSLIGMTGIIRDISQRKQMEESIRRREEQFSALLQNSSDAISILDKNGLIIFENSNRNRISDYTIEELIGKSIYDFIHPDETDNFLRLFNELYANPGRQLKREYRGFHKNKKWIYIESIFSNQLNNPAINGIIVNSRDISERKMAELKERVYHDNLIFLSNSALDLMGLSSKEDIYDYISEKLYHFLENVIVVVSSFNNDNRKMTIESISAPEQAEKVLKQMLNKSIIGLNIPVNTKITNLSNAGTIMNVKDQINPAGFEGFSGEYLNKLFDQLNVNKVYNIALARHNILLGNITVLTLNRTIIKFKHIIETFVHQVSVALQRSHLESELVKAKEKAEESDKLKTAFLANMSHEIRTPMNGILGFAEILNDEKLSPGNKKKYIDIIHSNGKMLINLIDDIIDFAKIEAGQISIQPKDFSLNNLLNQVYASFLTEQLKREKTDVKLRIRKGFPGDECFIRTDPNRLRQILTNLVGNALKFTNSGIVEFGYRKPDGKKLLFYVKDTGIGIAKNKLDVIFERFIQADSSSTRRHGGSGLGLAISKGFVELLGGEIWAESETGKGSLFSFTIPYSPALVKKEEGAQHSKPQKEYVWENRTFLIAEDDKFSYKFLESFLKQTKANVIHAIDGKEAVSICQSNQKIDLILMDIQMPEMNGLEATEIIKRFNKSLPIIAQTANAIVEERQKCFEAGCDDFITKPVNIVELFAKIENWLTAEAAEK